MDGDEGAEPADAARPVGGSEAAETDGTDAPRGPADRAATASVVVRNVGGIESATVDLAPGVTVLAGRNATNRTSFLRALRAVLGADTTPLKRDADEGHVELTLDGETYTRRFERTESGVRTGGDPFLDDATAADTFAVLLEDNDVRRAVRSGDGLAEVLMRPVDTDAIEAEIDRLTDEKRRIDRELADLDGLDAERATLEGERERLAGEIDRLEGELADLEERIDAADASLDAGIERDERLEARLADLREARAELESVTDDLDAERDSLAAVEREHERVESELAETTPVDEAELAALDDDIAALRERKRRLDADVSALQGIVRFNESQLDEGGPDLLDGLAGGADADGRGTDAGSGDGDHVTDQLSGGESVTCWTCGSTVDRAEIEGTLDRLRDLRERTLARRRDLADRIDRLDARRRRLRERSERRTDLVADRDRIETELERREQRVSDLERRRRELNERVRDLEETVEQLRTDDYADLLDLHRRANECQVDLERHRSDLATVESELAAVDERIDERDRLEGRREEVQSELVDCRTRLDRTAAEVVATFNDHADAVLDALDYENVARVRLVRTADEEGGVGSFDLRVVRAGEGGAVADTTANLSESEREVVGLVLALAGYLVHGVGDAVPFVLLDSLEAIDAERIAALVDYVADHATFLVAALLEEDAAAVDAAHDRVTEI